MSVGRCSDCRVVPLHSRNVWSSRKGSACRLLLVTPVSLQNGVLLTRCGARGSKCHGSTAGLYEAVVAATHMRVASWRVADASARASPMSAELWPWAGGQWGDESPSGSCGSERGPQRSPTRCIESSRCEER